MQTPRTLRDNSLSLNQIQSHFYFAAKFLQIEMTSNSNFEYNFF